VGVRVRFWKGAYWVFVNVGGRRKAQKIGPDKRLADEVARKARRAIARGEFRIADRAPQRAASGFKAIAEEWLRTCQGVRNIRPNTIDNYRTAVVIHLIPYFGTTPLTDITRGKVRAFIADLLSAGGSARFKDRPLGRLTVRNVVAVLRMILQDAEDEGLVPSNAAARVGRFGAHTARVDPFTPGEIQAILAAALLEAGPDIATLLRLWAQAGLREGEVLALRRDALGLDRGEVTVRATWSHGRLGPPKNRYSERTTSFLYPTAEPRTTEWRPGRTRGSRLVLADLRRLPGPMNPSAFVFGGAAPYSAAKLRVVWARVLKAASITRYRPPETLRHSWASILLSRSAPLLAVVRAGGWRNARVLLDVYAKWVPEATLGQGPGGQDFATPAQPGSGSGAEIPSNPSADRAVPGPFPLLPDVEAEVADLPVAHEIVLALEPELSPRAELGQ
jgi:integrase